MHTEMFRHSGSSVRIVYILTSLGMGGAERQAISIAERVANRGHQVSILVLRPRLREEWTTALPVHHLNMRRTPLSFAVSLLHTRRILRNLRPDLIHSHSFHANIFARLLKLFVPRSVILSTIHNVYEGASGRMLAYRLTDPLATLTTVVSHVAADRFVRLKAVSVRKCIVLPNAIDISLFTPDLNRRLSMRATPNAASNGAFIWLAAGRHVPAKDFPNLIKAFAEVSKAAPHAQLWIAGQSSDGHKEQQSGEGGIAALLKTSHDQVRYLGLRRDMPALFDAADAFVLASAWEGMPLVLAEAMAMEKPVVATDVGGVRELLGETGHIVPPKDSAALARAMLAVMAQPCEDRQAQGYAERQRITQNFSMDTRAGEWEMLYRSLFAAAAKKSGRGERTPGLHSGFR